MKNDWLILNQLSDQLPLICTLEQLHPSLRYFFKRRLHHRFILPVNLDLPLRHPLRQRLCRSFPLLCQKVDHDEPSNLQTAADDFEPVLDPVRLAAIAVIVRHHPARRYPPVPLHPRQHQVQDLPAHVVEIHLHESVRRADQRVPEASVLVVQAHVRAEAFDPAALSVRAREPDNTLAAQDVLRDLHYHAARRARCAAHDDRVVGPGASDLRDAEPSGEARGAEAPQVLRWSDALERGQGLAFRRVEDRVLAPAGHTAHLLARFECGGCGVQDLGDGDGVHGAVELHRRAVQPDGVDGGGDPAPLGGVVGEVEGPEEDLVVGERGNRFRFKGEGWFGSGEDRGGGGFVGEDPLPSFGREGHDETCTRGVSLLNEQRTAREMRGKRN